MLVPSSDWGPMIKNLEIKPLCHLILKKTIDDEDKYQAGLTKIFFRAGMLAALESLRSERLNALVVLIQKNVRRRLAVKRYQSMRKAAIKIETSTGSTMNSPVSCHSPRVCHVFRAAAEI